MSEIERGNLRPGLVEHINATFDSATVEVGQRVSAEIDRSRREIDRMRAGVLSRYWQGLLSPAEGESISAALVITDGKKVLPERTISADQLLSIDRSDPIWHGSKFDSGTGEASVVVRKTGQDGIQRESIIKVAPFPFEHEDGTAGVTLRLEEVVSHMPEKGALFRGKPIIS